MSHLRATQAGVAELAARRHGVIAWFELYALGVSPDLVASWSRSGRLWRVHRGVYAVGRPGLTRAGEWLAAVLACGPGPGGPAGFLSFRAAAALWGIGNEREGEPIDVTIRATGGRQRRDGFTIHRCMHLWGGETTEHDGIPATTVTRTILDLAGTVAPGELRRAVDDAQRLGLCRIPDLAEMIRAHRGERGVARLRELLDRYDDEPGFSRSELERRFLDICHGHGLPPPRVNVRLLGLEVDFVWPKESVIVEVDGFAAHGTGEAFQRDRDRDSQLAAAGYQTIRFTWRDITTRPTLVAHRVRRLLAIRRTAGRTAH